MRGNTLMYRSRRGTLAAAGAEELSEQGYRFLEERRPYPVCSQALEEMKDTAACRRLPIAPVMRVIGDKPGFGSVPGALAV